MDLSTDRPRFILRKDMMTLIPSNIKKRIIHPGDNGQIQGFQELFVHLERSSAADELRALIVEYFMRSPQLRAHLSQLLSTLLLIWKPESSFLMLVGNPTANPIANRMSHHTILAVNPPPPAPGTTSLTGSPGLGSRPQRQDSALTVFDVDAEDAATDTSSAPTSPVRETSPRLPSRAASMAVNAKAGPTKLHREPLHIEPTPPPLSLMNQRIFLAFGADPGQRQGANTTYSVLTPYSSFSADEKLHTFHFKDNGFIKHPLGIDLLQTHQT